MKSYSAAENVRWLCCIDVIRSDAERKCAHGECCCEMCSPLMDCSAHMRCVDLLDAELAVTLVSRSASNELNESIALSSI